jgi:hypothetical protein
MMTCDRLVEAAANTPGRRYRAVFIADVRLGSRGLQGRI